LELTGWKTILGRGRFLRMNSNAETMGRVTHKTKAASELPMPLWLIRNEPVFACCLRKGC